MSREFRSLGEQWVEEINGEMHMLKAVKQTNQCSGCVFCVPFWCGDPIQSEREFDCSTMIIKDLGILQEGKLPSSFGVYPTTIAPTQMSSGWVLYAWLKEGSSFIKKEVVYADTEQEAIEAWNRRM